MSKGQLTKVYLRLDPDADQHPDVEGLVLLMCAANRQRPRGRFHPDIVKKILGPKRMAAWLKPKPGKTRPDLLPQGDGTLYLDGWDEWQEGDHTVGERVARLRARRSTTVTTPVTQPLQERSPDRNPPPRHQALGVNGRSSSNKNPETSSSSPGDDDESRYVAEVVALYTAMPGTRDRPTRSDLAIAKDWFKADLPLAVVRAAVVMAIARRVLRTTPITQRIASLAYFRDAIAEAKAAPPDPDYVDLMASRIRSKQEKPL